MTRHVYTALLTSILACTSHGVAITGGGIQYPNLYIETFDAAKCKTANRSPSAGLNLLKSGKCKAQLTGPVNSIQSLRVFQAPVDYSCDMQVFTSNDCMGDLLATVEYPYDETLGGQCDFPEIAGMNSVLATCQSIVTSPTLAVRDDAGSASLQARAIKYPNIDILAFDFPDCNNKESGGGLLGKANFNNLQAGACQKSLHSPGNTIQSLTVFKAPQGYEWEIQAWASTDCTGVPLGTTVYPLYNLLSGCGLPDITGVKSLFITCEKVIPLKSRRDTDVATIIPRAVEYPNVYVSAHDDAKCKPTGNVGSALAGTNLAKAGQCLISLRSEKSSIQSLKVLVNPGGYICGIEISTRKAVLASLTPCDLPEVAGVKSILVTCEKTVPLLARVVDRPDVEAASIQRTDHPASVGVNTFTGTGCLEKFGVYIPHATAYTTSGTCEDVSAADSIVTNSISMFPIPLGYACFLDVFDQPGCTGQRTKSTEYRSVQFSSCALSSVSRVRSYKPTCRLVGLRARDLAPIDTTEVHAVNTQDDSTIDKRGPLPITALVTFPRTKCDNADGISDFTIMLNDTCEVLARGAGEYRTSSVAIEAESVAPGFSCVVYEHDSPDCSGNAQKSKPLHNGANRQCAFNKLANPGATKSAKVICNAVGSNVDVSSASQEARSIQPTSRSPYLNYVLLNTFADTQCDALALEVPTLNALISRTCKNLSQPFETSKGYPEIAPTRSIQVVAVPEGFECTVRVYQQADCAGTGTETGPFVGIADLPLSFHCPYRDVFEPQSAYASCTPLAGGFSRRDIISDSMADTHPASTKALVRGRVQLLSYTSNSCQKGRLPTQSFTNQGCVAISNKASSIGFGEISESLLSYCDVELFDPADCSGTVTYSSFVITNNCGFVHVQDVKSARLVCKGSL